MLFDGWTIGGNGGSASQLFCVDPGSWYQISFDYTGIPSQGLSIGPVIVEVTWDGSNPAILFETTVNPTATYQTETFSLQIPGYADKLTLWIYRAFGEGQGYSASIVDNVMVQKLEGQP
jgi:hypothetical protein